MVITMVVVVVAVKIYIVEVWNLCWFHSLICTLRMTEFLGR